MQWGVERERPPRGREGPQGRVLAAFYTRRERDILLQARFNLWISNEVRRLAQALGVDTTSDLTGRNPAGSSWDSRQPDAELLRGAGVWCGPLLGSAAFPC